MSRDATERPDEPKPLRYSTSRLAREPIKIPTCHGPAIIGAEFDEVKRVFRITFLLPKLDADPPKGVVSA